MKSLILAFLLLLFFNSTSVKGEFVVYKTSEDLKNKKGEKYDDFHSYTWVGEHVTLVAVRNNEKHKIKCADIYAVVYKDQFFRIHKDDIRETPARLMNVGKLCYYENGLVHMVMLRDNSKEAVMSRGFGCYFSKDVNSKIEPLIGNKKIVKQQKIVYPEYSELFDNIKNMWLPVQIWPVVQQFEAKK